MSKVLHLKIPMQGEDDFAISAELLGQFMKFIQQRLGKGYEVIASPCDPSLKGKGSILYNFDLKDVSLEDIKNMIALDKTEKV